MKTKITIVETVRGAFECRAEPRHKVNGRRLWEHSVTQLSGVPLTEEEWREYAKQIVAELVARGRDITEWEVEPIEED